MKVSDFDFELPKELIAQTPLLKRDTSKMMVVDIETKAIKNEVFKNIIDYLQAGDTLILNNTKVLPARLFGKKRATGAQIELLLLKDLGENLWEVLAKPAKKLEIGTELIFGAGSLIAKCVEVLPEGMRVLEFAYDGIFLEIIEELGKMPLPPYIKESLPDNSRYQTVYAKEQGSSAAPTAGLHFSDELLAKIAKKGVNIAFITLHVGLGTFRPVTVDLVADHKMHAEYYYISDKTAETLQKTRASGKKIYAVGTTSARTLETIAAQNEGNFVASSGWTDIFITPGFNFCAIDGLLTNFHLPKSSLMMLVSAFATRELIMSAYAIAISEKYRFFSFGDAMLLGNFNLPKEL